MGKSGLPALQELLKVAENTKETKVSDMRASVVPEVARMMMAAVYGAACRAGDGGAGSIEDHAREGLRFANLVFDAVADPEREARLLKE